MPTRAGLLTGSADSFPVADIKRTLDAMSWVKLNQFHWHVVDSQSFPLQIPGFTDLAAKGAYSSSQVYTPNDVQDIIAYAGAVSLLLRPLPRIRPYHGVLLRGRF